MNLSMKWLKEFVDIDVTPKQFASDMTMSGSKVECYETEGEKIKNVVVGQILSIEKHPDADKLSICQIDVGENEPVQIITGANNISVGDKIPVAKDNSVLSDGTKIRKGKLRGIPSCGMLCSLGELGLSVNDFPYAIEDGIFILQEDCYVGQDIRDAIGFNDTTIEFEITSNRPDCFSVIGLAREAAVTYNKNLKLHDPLVKAGNGDFSDMISINVLDEDLCPFYSTRIVKNVSVKPSPRWLRERLRAMGVRPINNIVDITNYVMLEYGQPMHAFDADKLVGNKIIVRRAKDGEEIKTLDDVDRKLNGNNLVIADAEKAVAIAGVMGGDLSSVSENTTTIVFESANFNGPSVRTTAKSQGLRTDSSSRFEKGLDVNNCIPALNRACELVELLDAGEVSDCAKIIDNSHIEPTKIRFDVDWINKFLDTTLSKDQMSNILTQLGCTFEGEYVIAPSYRPDLVYKADIAEEIARFYGYNKIKSTVISGVSEGKYSSEQKFTRKINETMFALGTSEIMTYSFISPKCYDKVLMPQNHELRNSVVISNPLGEDTSIMRTTALPSMLGALETNYKNRNSDVSLFEIAKEYIPVENAMLPIERNKLIAGMYGENIDFFSLKGIVEELLDRLSLYDYDIESSDNEYAYHPGRCAVLSINGEKLGVFGEIHPTVAENYGIGTRIFCLEIDVEILFRYSVKEKKYKQLPKFPAITRDIALICNEETPVLALEKTMKKAAGSLLETIKLFDVYKGKQIEEGKKSVAFSITLRSANETLTDEHATSAMNKIIKALESIGATLRS